MRKIPSFVLIRAFEAATRLQSFTLAAHELHLTPSAISHQVKELEEYFGRPLFIRRNRRVEATAEGRRLFLSVARVLDALEASCSEVTLAPMEQVLAVHCAPSFAVKWLGPRLPDFMQLFPKITIRLSSGAEPIDLTQVREIDIAISYGYAHERSGIEVTPLGKERIVPMCSPTLISNEKSASAWVASLPLIDSQLNQVTWRDWFSLNELPMHSRSRLSFDRAALAISAAADGMGIALESLRLAEKEISRGDLVEIGSDTFKPLLKEVHFVSERANEKHLEKVKAFREWLFRQVSASS